MNEEYRKWLLNGAGLWDMEDFVSTRQDEFIDWLDQTYPHLKDQYELELRMDAEDEERKEQERKDGLRSD